MYNSLAMQTQTGSNTSTWAQDVASVLASLTGTAQSGANIYTQIQAAQHGTYLGTNQQGLLTNPGLQVGGMNISFSMLIIAAVAILVIIILVK